MIRWFWIFAQNTAQEKEKLHGKAWIRLFFYVRGIMLTAAQLQERLMRKKAKIFRRIVLVFLVMCFLINFYLIHTTAGRIRKADEMQSEHFDCVLVLGASIINNSVPSIMLRDRLNVAIRAYEMGLTDTIIMSGDHRSDDYNEPEVMKQYAISMGVPEEAIILDHEGTSTFNSILYLQRNYSDRRVLIVTQKYHLYRALFIAEAKGVDAYGLDAALQKYSSAAYNTVREFFARIKDFGSVMFNLTKSDIQGI